MEVEAVAEAKLRTKIEYLKEDIKAIKEPSLIQSALEMEEDETDEDEADEIDEQEELQRKLKAIGVIPAGNKVEPAESKKNQWGE